MAKHNNYNWWIAGIIIIAILFVGSEFDLFFQNKGEYRDSCKTKIEKLIKYNGHV